MSACLRGQRPPWGLGVRFPGPPPSILRQVWPSGPREPALFSGGCADSETQVPPEGNGVVPGVIQLRACSRPKHRSGAWPVVTAGEGGEDFGPQGLSSSSSPALAVLGAALGLQSLSVLTCEWGHNRPYYGQLRDPLSPGPVQRGFGQPGGQAASRAWLLRVGYF